MLALDGVSTERESVKDMKDLKTEIDFNAFSF